MKKLIKFVPTTLDFYPSYTFPNDQREKGLMYVKVFCLQFPNKKDGYKVGIWGGDDCGWDFETLSKSEAIKEWRSIESVDVDFTKYRKGWIHG